MSSYASTPQGMPGYAHAAQAMSAVEQWAKNRMAFVDYLQNGEMKDGFVGPFHDWFEPPFSYLSFWVPNGGPIVQMFSGILRTSPIAEESSVQNEPKRPLVLMASEAYGLLRLHGKNRCARYFHPLNPPDPLPSLHEGFPALGEPIVIFPRFYNPSPQTDVPDEELRRRQPKEPFLFHLTGALSLDQLLAETKGFFCAVDSSLRAFEEQYRFVTVQERLRNHQARTNKTSSS
ncbi:MAG TPA: hypothetical protein VJI75_02120 [Candidatus Nanoarchaeia archaeon]|nr:hypothetical protein [Candidatus Nanoarchaeia archaeon]